MIEFQAVDGPYGRWLLNVKRIVGPRIWDLLQDMEGPEVDVILASKGVVPFEDSVEFHRFLEAMFAEKGMVKAPAKPKARDAIQGADGVRLVPVQLMPDGLIEIQGEDDPESRAAKFPKFTRDLD